MGMHRISRRWAALAAVAFVTTMSSCTGTGNPPGTTTTTRPTTPPQHQEGFWELSGDVAAHDPSIIKAGTTWYTFTTGIGISMTTSPDGLRWGNRRQVFANPLPWWGSIPGHTNVADVWAPDVKWFNGQYHLFYSISSFGSRNSAIGHATSTSLTGGWQDQGKVIETRHTDSNGYNAIDPELVIDASGKPWLAFGSFWDGIHIVPLNSNMKVAGTPRRIAQHTSGIEAPSIVYRNGYYYLFVSWDSCCRGVDSTYKIAVGRSTRIDGGYVDRNGRAMLDGNGTVLDSGNVRWKGPGGQDVNEGNVLARHAYDATDNGNPKLLINGLRWDSAGWPTY